MVGQAAPRGYKQLEEKCYGGSGRPPGGTNSCGRSVMVGQAAPRGYKQLDEKCYGGSGRPRGVQTAGGEVLWWVRPPPGGTNSWMRSVMVGQAATGGYKQLDEKCYGGSGRPQGVQTAG